MYLATPHRDAKAVAALLERRFGFTTTMRVGEEEVSLLLLDATLGDIGVVLKHLRERLSQNDSLLVYYAGHGTWDEKSGHSAWLPVDAEPGNPMSEFAGYYLRLFLKSVSAQKVLVVSDSCYAGRLLRDAGSAPPQAQGDERSRALLASAAKQSRVFIAAGGTEPVLDSTCGGDNRHSCFAGAFLAALQAMDERVFTAQELFVTHIVEKVQGNARQEPRYSYIEDSGHDGGDFIFERMD